MEFLRRKNDVEGKILDKDTSNLFLHGRKYIYVYIAVIPILG